ncbi:MAG: signal peptidase II [Gemmatimonadota bacterium]
MRSVPLLQPKARVAGPTLLFVVVLDQITKTLASSRLQPEHVPHSIVGDFIRLTLTHNTGAAMSLSVGPWSRVVFSVVALVALVLLYRVYHDAPPDARWRALALALIAGGATGNLIDRIRSAHGVVDFIDIGLPVWRFWTFNVADIGVTCGALLLIALMWHETPAHDS